MEQTAVAGRRGSPASLDSELDRGLKMGRKRWVWTVMPLKAKDDPLHHDNRKIPTLTRKPSENSPSYLPPIHSEFITQ